jgi:hypothetical protein
MAPRVRWHQSLAWKFFLRMALAILALVGVVLAVARDQSRKRARESAEAGIRVASQMMERSLAAEARVMDAGLEVFTNYSLNLAYIEKQDVRSVRDNLLENLANFRAGLAAVVRPDGSLLACTTDGHRQDYSDVGIVQMAMHPEEAAQAGERGPSYHGYLRIDGGAYKGLYHGVARRLVMPGGAFAGAMLVANRLDDAEAVQLRRQAMVRLRDSDPPAHVSLVSARGITGSTV